MINNPEVVWILEGVYPDKHRLTTVCQDTTPTKFKNTQTPLNLNIFTTLMSQTNRSKIAEPYVDVTNIIPIVDHIDKLYN